MHFAACFGNSVPEYESNFFNVLMLNSCSNVNTRKLRCTGSEKTSPDTDKFYVFFEYIKVNRLAK
jgi:hypothetical protein